MASYDSSVIVAFADKLYSQAATVAATYAAIGALVGAGVGAAIGNAVSADFLIPALAGAIVVGAIAFQLGRQKGFALRLQAQVALCQVEIETNTRSAAT
jgi:outer membrane lipoprotein SlyB